MTDDAGGRIGVLIGIDEYHKMLEDGAGLASTHAYDAAKASGDETIPFGQAVKRDRKLIMTQCPFCDAELVVGRREIEKGVWATVKVCPNCRDEWIDYAEHDWLVGLFKWKTFNLGGSVAVRIPKEIAVRCRSVPVLRSILRSGMAR